jgi:hypothetical protein
MVINLSTCCVRVSMNNPSGQSGQKQKDVPPKSSLGPCTDVDAIYFRNGGAIKIPDGSIYFIYSCEALAYWNGSVPPLAVIPPYRVRYLPDRRAAEKEFEGPILPPDPDPSCNCK